MCFVKDKNCFQGLVHWCPYHRLFCLAVQFVDSCDVFPDNSNDKFMALVRLRKGSFMNDSGNVVLFVYTVILGIHLYS